MEPSSVLEECWMRLVDSLGDFWMLICFYFTMLFCFTVSGISCWVCDKYHLLEKYKIQPNRYPTQDEYWQCLRNVAQNYVLVIFPLLFIAHPLFVALGFSSALPLPTHTAFFVQFVFFVVMEDIVHYFLHRLLHTPFLYKNVHKVHHKYTAPFGIAVDYAHPLETIVLGAATFSGPLLVRPHYSVFYCWVLFRQLDGLWVHSGYDIPSPLHFLPFYGGAVSHDYHHKSFIYNFSSRFTFMDHLFGTFRESPETTKTPKGQQ